MNISNKKTLNHNKLCIINEKRINLRKQLKSRNPLRVTNVSSSDTNNNEETKKVIVVGGGWAGFGAAKHLSQQGYKVTILDASKNPGGLSTGFRTEQGRSVEAGMKGFWYQYHNIFSLVNELEIENPFTEFTKSGFWSPEGLTTEGPVFSKLPRLPTLLGQFVYTSQLFKRVTLLDQLSMFRMLLPVVDFNSTKKTYMKYDEMTARELFQRAGITQNLYNEFLKPLLLVGLFAPPEEISAAAMMETMYFYALAHQYDFDICWCKGSVTEKLFNPLVNLIKKSNGEILGNNIVLDIKTVNDNAISVISQNTITGQESEFEADAVILAISIKGMKKLIQNSKSLAERSEFQKINNLKGLDVMATRIWFDKLIETKFPSNVLARFEEDVGGTFFNLNDLQDEAKESEGTVIAADFYHSNTMMSRTDDQIIQDVKSYLTQCEPGFANANILDSAVLRFYESVTHFSPGSYKSRPTQDTSINNLFIAGDWVKDVKHGANGLSQERAYVTGLIAANKIIEKFDIGEKAEILDVEPDEAHIALLKDINTRIKSNIENTGLDRLLLLPW